MSNDKGTEPAFPVFDCKERYLPTGLSQRSYAAIHLRVPQSEHEWLNSMIRESQRQEFAGQSLAGQRGTETGLIHQSDVLAKLAYADADAMLKASEVKE